MEILDQISGRPVTEEIIHGCGHFESALVPMPPHRFDPTRIKDATMNHSDDLFLQGAHARLIGATGIPMVNHGSSPAELFHSGMQPALKLEIIIRIKNVMLAIVLVLMHNFYFRKTGAEQACLFFCRSIAVKGEAAPSAKNICQITL